jgi:hypothetical protein
MECPFKHKRPLLQIKKGRFTNYYRSVKVYFTNQGLAGGDKR